MKNILKSLIGLGLLILIACNPNPEPEDGFTKSLYLSADFDGENYVWESDSEKVELSWFPQEEGNVEWNILESTSGNGEMEVAIHFGKSVEKSDITSLAGTTIANSPGNGFPYFKVFWIGNPEYTNGLDVIDYGPGEVKIDEVINTGRIDYNEPLTGDEKRGRSYVIRGSFDINISSSSWSPDVPVKLYPFKNGKFSMRLVVPD